MITTPKLIRMSNIPVSLVNDLERQEAALWLVSCPDVPSVSALLPDFLGLPWRMVLCELYDPHLISALESHPGVADPWVQKRGFVQIIDRDPSLIGLPDRCLPVYLLNGRGGHSGDDFRDKFRRMSMLDVLRRSNVRHLIIVSGEDSIVPSDLHELWRSGFRAHLTIISDASVLSTAEAELADVIADLPAVGLLYPASEIIESLMHRYMESYTDDRCVIRKRDSLGTLKTVDVRPLDEPERPIMEYYSLIQENDLSPLMADQLTEDDFVDFFKIPKIRGRHTAQVCRGKEAPRHQQS